MSKAEEISKEEFSNDNVSAVVTKFVGCKSKIEATVSPKLVEESYQKALKNINKEVNIPGFRKGKAPTELILKNYASNIDREWKDLVANTAFFEIVDLSQLKIFKDGIKKVDIKNCSRENGATVLYDVETFPNVPDIDVGSLEIEDVEPKSITDKELEDGLKNLRLRIAEWDPVTDRGVQEGDIVVIDVDVLDEPTHRPVNDLEVEVSPETLPNWIMQLIIGLKPEESAEGMRKWEPAFAEKGDLTPPKDYKDERCRVTVNRIFIPKLPELDDEFAKKHGLESVDALKEAVKKQKEMQLRQQEDEQLRKKMRKLLVDKYIFDVPSRMHEREIQQHRSQTDEQLKKMKYSAEAHKEKLSNLEPEITKGAHEIVRYNYLVHKMAQQLNLNVTQEEILAYFQPMLQNPMYQQLFLEKKLDMEAMQSFAVEKILELKVLDHLIQQAKRKK